jgi:hypothetical protein
MKRTAYMTLAAVALVLMTLVPAYAQKMSATVNIPFAFTVDDVRMPAGEYLITSPSEKVITIKRVGGPEVETTMINGNEGHKGDHTPRLIFHRYGTEYFLATAFLPAQDHSHEFVVSAAEIQVARNTRQQTNELAMNVAK